jgi:Trk-type K+ transport system membrane component
MSSIPFVQGDTNLTPEECHLHGAKLTRLEVSMEYTTKLIEDMKTEYLHPIKEQTTKTNGRVTTLENGFIRNKVWIFFLSIGISLLGAVVFELVRHQITGK